MKVTFGQSAIRNHVDNHIVTPERGVEPIDLVEAMSSNIFTSSTCDGPRYRLKTYNIRWHIIFAKQSASIYISIDVRLAMTLASWTVTFVDVFDVTPEGRHDVSELVPKGVRPPPVCPLSSCASTFKGFCTHTRSSDIIPSRLWPLNPWVHQGVPRVPTEVLIEFLAQTTALLGTPSWHIVRLLVIPW